MFIFSMPPRDCPDCGGTGYDPYDGGQCDTCAGEGEIGD